ncbi:unnamed protein product [Urochloa humidicola]
MASASRALAPSQEVLFDDLYREILLRVPADRPQRLIRFALVSKAWRRVLADPDFHRRYLEFHNMPPLIGYILNCTDFRGQFARLVSTTRPPFSARLPRNGAHLVAEDSRHGRVLFSSTSGREKDYVLIVWDPVTDHQQEVRLPETFPIHIPGFKIAVLCDVRDCDHRRCHGGPFRLVFVGPDGWPGFDYKWEVPALVYTSASGAWTDSPAGFATNVNGDDDWGFRGTPPALLGSALYFLSSRILQYRFGSEGERLMYIDVPEGYVGKGKDCGVVIMPAADGRLGLAAMYSDRINTRIHIWETEIGAGGEVHWVEKARMPVRGYNLLGVAASHALFIRTTVNGVRCIDLESGKFQNFEKLDSCQTYSLVPLLSFDTPDPHPASDGDDPKGEKASSSASTSRIGHGLKH